MKVITTNLLNRFWENGIKPIKTALGGKLDVTKVIKSTNITEPGFVMDGKTAADAFAQLNKNLMPVVLFNNDSASVTSDITLSQSAAIFNRIEILYKINTKSYNLTPTNVNYHSATVYNPNGKRVSLFAITRNSDEVDGLYLHSKEVVINGTKINTYKANEYHTYRFKIEDGHAGIHADFIGITTVLGFYV